MDNRKVKKLGLLLVAGGSVAAGPAARAERPPKRVHQMDVAQYPYSPGTIYRVKLMPEAPLAVELPAGEVASFVTCDRRWWQADYTVGSKRIFLRAIGATEIVGKKGFVHIVTSPSDMRITIKVEAVDGEDGDVPGALQIYRDGASPMSDPSSPQFKQALGAHVLYAQKFAEEKAAANYQSWRQQALANFRASYDWGGDFRITRVVDDGVQTFITVPSGSDRAVIQFVDKTGKKEPVNHEFLNGVYTVQNKVLKAGEKFRLILGKEQAWVGVK